MESLYTHNSVTTAQFVTNRLQRESVWNSHLESEKHKKNLRVWNPLYRTPNRLFEEETTAPNTTTRKQREHKKDEIQAQHTIPSFRKISSHALLFSEEENESHLSSSTRTNPSVGKENCDPMILDTFEDSSSSDPSAGTSHCSPS